LREEHRLRVLENRVLRRIFGTKGDEVTGGWIRLHNEDLNGLYFAPNIFRVIKSRRMRWTGNVARRKEELCTRFWWGDLGEGDHLEYSSVDCGIILKSIFK
jgi:hypothetical protein